MGEFARTTTRDAQPGGRAARDASRALERMREFPAPVTGGRPMEPAVAASFAGLIGRDLSRIRLHDDEFAADLAGALDAEAVTIGDDVYLAADAGELRGSRGRALLAHELAHSASGSEAVGDRAPGQEEATAEMTRPTELADEAIDEGTPRPAPVVVGVPRAARRPVATRSDREAGTPDVVSASEALVRLVDRLLSRDAADTGGRAAAVLGRLQPDVREAVVTTVAAKGGGHLTGDLDRAKHARPPEDGGRPDAPAVEEGAEPERPADESTPAEAATPTGATTKEQTPGTETAAQPQAGAGETLPQAGPSGEGGPEAAGGEPSEQPPAAAAVTAEKGELPAGEGGGPSAVPAEGAAESGGVPAPGGAADAGASPEAAAPENLADTEGAAAAQGADAPLAADAEEPLVEVDTGESDAESVVAPPADAATPEAPTTAEPPATALEPQDPPEISNPPEPENDTAPSLPAPPAPIEDPAAPVADDDSASPLATAPDADLAPEPLDAVSGMEAEAAEPSGRQDAAPAPEGGEGDGAAAPPAPPADDAAGAVLDDPKPPSGGGGGGAAIPDPPATAVPDVSVMQPQAALNSVASLPPTKLSAGLAGVSASASRTVGEAGAELEANPPSMERPSGVPADKDASLPKAPLPPLPPTPKRTVQEVAGGPGATPPVPAGPPPAPAPVTAGVATTTVRGDTQISAEDASRVQGAVKSLPTTDPALRITAGPVPVLTLVGSENPGRVTDQAAKVAAVRTGLQADGLGDARADMGENGVLPHVPKEVLTADLATAAPAKAGPTAAVAAAPAAPAAGGGAAVPDIAVDAVAMEQGGPAISAATQAQGTALGTASSDHTTSTVDAKSEADRQINEEIAANGGEQTAARSDVRTAVGKERADWVGEQKALSEKSQSASEAAVTAATDEVTGAQGRAEDESDEAVKEGNDTITEERESAEREAREKKEKAEKESEEGGFFSWIGSKVASFFDGIKKAISVVFDAARKAVDLAISAAQKIAVAAIEVGRRAVVAAIEIGGKALAVAGDIVLAGFPEARDRFRKKIEEKVDAATKKVNEFADKLKEGVKKLLDGLGKLLKGALTLLEKAYTAAIDAVAKVVDTAIKAAKAWVDTIVGFAMIIGDIAANPLQWLRNLGASLMDGVKNHVWRELVTGVKNWFTSTVESIVGVGKAVIDVLRKGGITFGKIVSIAWTAIKESMPGILIGLLIEKLVSILIPVAGALKLIIDGLRAAWGAASQILAAFQKFLAFLKAVKPGNAGKQFGELVAAAAVAVMAFLAQFVLIKLKGAGQKVGGTLRKLAEKFGKVVKKVAGGVKRGAKAAAGVVKRSVVAVAKGVKKGAVSAAKAIKRVIPKGALKVAASAAKKVATVVKKGVAKVKQGYRKAKEKIFGKKKKRPKETKEQKLARAIERTKASLQNLRRRGAMELRWVLTLAWLKRRWRWRTLNFISAGTGGQRRVEGQINPTLVEDVGMRIDVASATQGGSSGAIRFFQITEALRVRYGAGGGPASGDFEKVVVASLTEDLLKSVDQFKDMAVLKPSELRRKVPEGNEFAENRRVSTLESSSRRLSTAETLIPHGQMAALSKGGKTIPEVVAYAPLTNTAVSIEAQLSHDWADPRHVKTSSRKVLQTAKRPEALAEKITTGDFARTADPSQRPHIVMFIVAPEWAHAQNTVPTLKKIIEDFTKKNTGTPFFVEIRWIKQPTVRR